MWLAAAVLVVGVGAVLLLGLSGWPGPTIDCTATLCFCELPRPGLVRQPSNTWSNLVPALAGMGLAWRFRAPSTTGQRLVAVAMPPVLVFQGVGSMLFHGGLTTWGAALDAMSMFATVAALVATNLVRLERLGSAGFGAFLGGLTGGGLATGFISGDAVTWLMFSLFVTVLATEVVLGRRGRSRGWRFRAGVALHLGGVSVWFASLWEGLPLCWPHSPAQGHALWHMTEAGAVALFALHAWHNLEGPPPRGAWPAGDEGHSPQPPQ